MNELKGNPGELRATVHIERGTTGKVDTFYIVGGVSPEQAAALAAEGILPEAPRKEHGSSGAVVGPGSNITITPKE